MNEGTFFSRKFGGKRTARRYAGAPTVVDAMTPAREKLTAEKEEHEANARIKTAAIAEMKEKLRSIANLDTKDIDAAIKHYENEPGIQAETKQGVTEMMARTKGMSPDQFAERLARDADEVFEASRAGNDIAGSNILVPFLASQGLIEREKSEKEARQNLSKTHVSKGLTVGPTGRVKLVIGSTAKPVAFMTNLVLAGIDYSAGAQAGAAALTDAGAGEAVVKYGSGIGSAAVNIMLLERKTRVKGRPGYVMPWVLGAADLVWGKTTASKVGGAFFAAGLAVMAPAMYGNVKRSSVDAAVSGEVGAKMKEAYQAEVEKVRAEMKKAQGLFGALKPSLDQEMIQAFKEGGEGWGPRTYSKSLALFGTTSENEANYAAFLADPKGRIPHPLSAITPLSSDSAPKATDETLTKAKQKLADAQKIAGKKERRAAVRAAEAEVSAAMKAAGPNKGTGGNKESIGGVAPDPEQVKRALAEINARYGLTPTDGAEQLLKKLTDEINQINPEETFKMLEHLLEQSTELSESGLAKQMLGSVASVPHIAGVVSDNLLYKGHGINSFTQDVPWEELAHGATGIRSIFQSEDQYLAARNDMAKKLQSATVSLTLQKYLTDVFQATGVDARMDIPTVSFSLPTETQGIDRAPYEIMIKKTIWDHIEIPSDDSEEWKHIARTFEQSGIPVDVSTPEGKRKAIGMLFGLIIGLLAGGVVLTIGAKKLHRRWVEEAPLSADEQHGLFKTEMEVVKDMTNLMQTREKSLLTNIAKQAGGNLGLEERDPVAIEAVLQRRLREYVLQRMNPPMDQTPAGTAFLNRQSHIGNRDLRQLYATTLNTFIDEYKSGREEATKALLASINPERDRELAALQGFVNATSTVASPAAVRSNVIDWYGRIDGRFRADELKSREANVQDLYARREALISLRSPLSVPLSPETPPASVSPADIVVGNELSEIDSILQMQHDAVRRISHGSTATPLPRDPAITYSSQRRQELAREVQQQELSNRIGSVEVTRVAEEYSALAQGLGKRVNVLEAAILNSFGDQAKGAKVNFEYAYDARVPGFTINAVLAREGTDNVVISFGSQLPSPTLPSDEAIIEAFEKRLAPESTELRVMKYEAMHDAYRRATDEIKAEVIADHGDSSLFESTALTDEIAADLDDIIMRRDILRVQEEIMTVIRNGQPLSSVQAAILEAPGAATVSGIWNANIRRVLTAAQDRNPGDRVAYDVRNDQVMIASPDRGIQVMDIRDLVRG